MKKELEEKLLKNYPKLYRQYYWDMTQTAMNWGFCCGDGWYDIINDLSEKLSKFDVEAVQVKEKFGGLRYYYTVRVPNTRWNTFWNRIRTFFYSRRLGRQYNWILDLRSKFYKTIPEKIDDLVWEAEKKSVETCEVCGKSGSIKRQGWLRCLCDECEKKEDL